MPITSEQIQLIDQFIAGELSEEKMAAFKKEIRDNIELSHYYFEEIDLRNALEEMQFRKEFGDVDVESILANKESIAIKAILTETQSQDQSVSNKEKNIQDGGKLISIKRWVQFAVAASVLGVIISLLWITLRNDANDNPGSVATNTMKNDTITPVHENSKKDIYKLAENLFTEFFGQDKTPEKKPLLIASALNNFDKSDYRLIKDFNADNPPTVRGIEEDDADSRQNLQLLGHYYKGLSYIATGDDEQAKQHLQWVVDNTKDKQFINKATWYKALCYLRTGSVDSARLLLNKIANIKDTSPYNDKARLILEKLER